MSRPPEGVGHVDRLDGPEDLKWRLRVLLETLVGQISVAQACEELGVSESRLHELRRQALVGALGALMPRPPGRPATAETTPPREQELLTRIGELEVDLQAALVRTELALAMPELFRGKKTAGAGKKPECSGPHRLAPAAEAARAATGEHRAGAEEHATGPTAARQRRARQAERTARRSAVAFAHWLHRRGLTGPAAARRLGLSASALSRWMRRWKEDRMTLRPRGRPVEDLDRDTRAGILAVFSLMGPHATLAALRDLFPDVARGALDNLLERCRSVYRRRKRWLVHTLRWTRPGTVWATDFTEPPAPIDGLYPRLLLVRDLASGRQLLALPCLGESAGLVVVALRSLFHLWGPPLVLKMDNGSAFISAELEALLQEHGVFALFSPPGTPAYNGSVEAGIGSLEVRAFYESARHDRPGEWTCDDVAVGCRQANDTAHPWGLGGPTPNRAWHDRTPITEIDARQFRSAYDQQRERECAERKIPSWQHRSHWLRASIDRVALSRALIERGYLLIRSRRVTPPITLPFAGRIS